MIRVHILLLLLSFSLLSCNGKEENSSGERLSTPSNSAETEREENGETRTETGLTRLEGQERNGSFPMEVKDFLSKVQDELVTKMRVLDEIEILNDGELQEVLGDYTTGPKHLDPKDVDVDFIISQIKNIRIDNRHKQDDGTRIFNYGKNDEGVFIRATDNFVSQYNSYSEYYAPRRVVSEIQRMILHEISHLWGFQESESYAFSTRVLELFTRYISGRHLRVDQKLVQKAKAYSDKKGKLKSYIQLKPKWALRTLFIDFEAIKSADIEDLTSYRCEYKDELKSLHSIKTSSLRYQAVKLDYKVAIVKVSDSRRELDYLFCVREDQESKYDSLKSRYTRFLGSEIFIKDILEEAYIIPDTLELFQKSLLVDFQRVVEMYEEFLEIQSKRVENFVSIKPKKLPEYKKCKNRHYGSSCLRLLNAVTKQWDESMGDDYFVSFIGKIKKVARHYAHEIKKRKTLVDTVLAYYVNEIKKMNEDIRPDDEKIRACAKYSEIRKITLCGIKKTQERVALEGEAVEDRLHELEDIKLEHQLLIERHVD